MTWTDIFTLVVAAISIASAIATVMHEVRMRARRRTGELQAAFGAIERHYETVTEIIEDPALPDALQDTLMAVTVMISDRQQTNLFVTNFLSADGAKQRKLPSNTTNEIERLRSSRPELVEKYGLALMSGIVGAILRWPETARRYAEFSAALAGTGQKEVKIASRVAELKREAGLHGGMPVAA